MTECVMTILFDGGRCAMTVVSSSEREFSGVTLERFPPYLDPHGCSNIRIIDSEEGIDSETPIQLYLGHDPEITPILLLEETQYDIRVSGDCDSAFNYLTSNGDTVAIRRSPFEGAGGDSLYTLRFGGYVGKGEFDVTIEGVRHSVPFEVRSKKIGYRSEYPKMLEDLVRFSVSLVLEQKAPLYQEFRLSDGSRETLYEEFMVLDYIFSELNVQDLYEYVRHNRHSMIVRSSEIVPAGATSDLDLSDLPFLVCGDNLEPMAGGPVDGHFSPVSVINGTCVVSYDTPENRVVKDLVLSIRNMCHALREHAPRGGFSGYVGSRLSEMCAFADSAASDRWLDSVGELETIPYGSTVLQSRLGYSELFAIYQILGLGVMLRDDETAELLRGQNSRLSRVYEYWCYTRIYRCLSEMSTRPPKPPIEADDRRWSVKVRKGTDFSIDVDGTSLSVRLYYNREFNRDREEFRSYSVRLRPDFTLVVTSPQAADRRFIVNLDAKYKVRGGSWSDVDVEVPSDAGDYWAYDVCKMHTYRDALLHCCASFILYPGNRMDLFPKPLSDDLWDSRSDTLLPSVGAIPLRPGDGIDPELRESLTAVFSRICDISEGEIFVEDVGNPLY